VSRLVVEGLQTGYGTLPVLHGISLQVGVDEVVAVVGPNGAGKTSLVKAIAGLLPVMTGAISFEGRDITRLPTSARHSLGISLVPQTGNTFPDLTVEDNLRVAFSTMGGADAARALDEAFATFPALADRRRQTARTLSGGERQMLAFASGVGTSPTLIALDEPTSGLGPVVVQSLVGKILRSRAEGSSILWVVEEDPLQILPHVDRVYVLGAGVIQAEMPASQLLADESLQRLFFGTRV
jgi:ABC-type branched-subunit amino acid transport system ATPase component